MSATPRRLRGHSTPARPPSRSRPHRWPPP